MKNLPLYESEHDRADTVDFFYSWDSDTLPHFHRCIEILYILSGEARCEVNGECTVCKKDDIIFVRKCAVHALSPAPRYADYVLVIGQRYSDDFRGIFQAESLPNYLNDRAFNRSLLPHFKALAPAFPQRPPRTSAPSSPRSTISTNITGNRFRWKAFRRNSDTTSTTFPACSTCTSGNRSMPISTRCASEISSVKPKKRKIPIFPNLFFPTASIP